MIDFLKRLFRPTSAFVTPVEAELIPTIRMRIYRAATDSWEDGPEVTIAEYERLS